jgi:hypothetical protein
MEISKEAFQDLTNRVIRLENLQQDPTAYRHSSEPRAWAAVESLITVGFASGSAVEEMKAKFPVLMLLEERMQERHCLLEEVGGLKERITQLRNELGACQASRLASEEQVDKLTAKVRHLRRLQRSAIKLVWGRPKKKKQRVLRKR